jgi:hypothetical protein
MKPTCVKYTNNHLYDFQSCEFLRLSGEGIIPLKIKILL